MGGGLNFLSEILFPMHPPGGWDHERKKLISSLQGTPRVLQFLGGKECFCLPFEELANLLRQKIDPHQFDDFIWWSHVFVAEKWLELEEKVSPGKRGKGKAAQQLVTRAIELARQKVRNGEIASTLGVSPSRVSNWEKRYPEFRAARNENSQKETRSTEKVSSSGIPPQQFLLAEEKNQFHNLGRTYAFLDPALLWSVYLVWKVFLKSLQIGPNYVMEDVKMPMHTLFWRIWLDLQTCEDRKVCSDWMEGKFGDEKPYGMRDEMFHMINAKLRPNLEEYKRLDKVLDAVLLPVSPLKLA